MECLPKRRFCELCLVLGLMSSGGGRAEVEMSKTEFFTNPPGTHYQNNARQVEVLRIPGAEALEVTVRGETEDKYDLLRIYDSKMREIRRLSGNLDGLPPFVVQGSSIKVTFNADKKTTARGASVKIATVSPLVLFNQFRERVLKAVYTVTSQGAAEANQEIERNLALLDGLQRTVERAGSPEAAVREVVNALFSVADAYARIAGMRASLAEENQKAFAQLQSLQQETHAHKQRIQDRKYGEEGELARLRNAVSAEINPNERQKMEISIKTRESLITSLEAQSRIWQNFYDTQMQLLDKLMDFAEKVNLLLYTLEMNAKVYRQAANVLQLDHNMLQALQALNDLSALESLLQDLEASWQAVESLKSQIGQSHFQN